MSVLWGPSDIKLTPSLLLLLPPFCQIHLAVTATCTTPDGDCDEDDDDDDDAQEGLLMTRLVTKLRMVGDKGDKDEEHGNVINMST